MRTDLLPLCDKHYRTMEFAVAPYNFNFSIEYFKCTDKFCHRCFSESIGYSTPLRNQPPAVLADQPRCEKHGRPMLISSLDRQHNTLRYACPEEGCTHIHNQPTPPSGR